MKIYCCFFKVTAWPNKPWICVISGTWARHGEMADLRAASLEKLIQLVRAGSGATLLPALAMQGPGPPVVASPPNRYRLPMHRATYHWYIARAFAA